MFIDDLGLVLEIEDSQGHIQSTDRDKLFNINSRSTDVYKNCCWVDKVPRKIINNLNADYRVKPKHAA